MDWFISLELLLPFRGILFSANDTARWLFEEAVAFVVGEIVVSFRAACLCFVVEATPPTCNPKNRFTNT